MVSASFWFGFYLFWLFAVSSEAEAFVCHLQAERLRPSSSDRAAVHASEEGETNSWLLEFTTASGEVINPYRILKVSRKATRREVREKYIQESRRYHPDGVRHKSILPGACNNLDDVRDQWERIKLSYEILYDSKRRRKYDRHEALADPGKAAKRAAFNVAVSGMTGIGKGLVDASIFAIRKVSNSNSKDSREATEF